MAGNSEKYHQYLNGESDSKGLDQEIAAFLEKVASTKVPEGTRSKAAIWEAIDSATEEEILPKKKEEAKTRKLWPLVIGIAASIALFLFFSPFFKLQDPIKTLAFESGIGEIKEVVLPDGSKATLNANSTISYSADWDRKLELAGEAFFEVVKGETFTVYTSSGQVEVLGTSFNVFSREHELIVACKTGKVKVTIPESQYAQVITPGETIVKAKDGIEQTPLTPDLIGKWQMGEFYFDKRPIGEVLKEIQRQYDVSIRADNLEDKLFSGYFSNESLDFALTVVCEPLNLSYKKINDKEIVITQN